MWTKFIHVNIKTGKRENHTNSFMDFLYSIEMTEVDTLKGYASRLKEIIEQMKENKASLS